MTLEEARAKYPFLGKVRFQDHSGLTTRDHRPVVAEGVINDDLVLDPVNGVIYVPAACNKDGDTTTRHKQVFVAESNIIEVIPPEPGSPAFGWGDRREEGPRHELAEVLGEYLTEALRPEGRWRLEGRAAAAGLPAPVYAARALVRLIEERFDVSLKEGPEV